MPLLENIRKCVRRRHGLSRRHTKVLFNVKISESFKSVNVPSQIRDLLVYIAREGVAVTDLFRRPGNPQDIKRIISDLEAGRQINWTEYNFYTLANIAKRYLLHLDGGILGPDAEERLLSTLDISDDQARIEAMHQIIVSQPKPVQQLLALLFGIWFRMIYHTEVNAMSVEAVAKSVAGSVFPSCTTTPRKVERASKVMEYLITGFASADLFSRELIEYFTMETKTSISRIEKFKYEFRFPKDVPREKSVRLFVRMLLEEGKKHGFHLIHDAVSREVFEKASWENVCVRNSDENMNTSLIKSLHTSTQNDDNFHKNDSLNVNSHHHHHHLTTSQTDRFVVDDETVLCTETSSTLTPTLPRRDKRLYNPEVRDSNLLTAPIQQTSEKRTCVTTTSLTETVTNAENRPNPMHNQRDSFMHDVSSLTSNPLLSQYSTQPVCTNDDVYMKQTSVRPTVPQSVCFNSVKRRQLERLQKRSDWFLSPPAGLRSGGLIHLDPSSMGTLRHNNSHNDLNKNTVINDKYSTAITEHHMGDIGSSLLTVNTDVDEVTTCCDLEHLDDDELSHLVHTAPEQLWLNGDVTFPKRRSHLISDQQQVIPAASSSPNWHNNLQTNRLLYGHNLDEKENYPEVETRYYVVERYYGPDPRPPSSYHVLNSGKDSSICRL